MKRALPALLLVALSAFAQNDTPDAPTWYQVEVIIFANRDPDAALSESWPPLPDLAYPARWQSLREGELNQPADREYRLQRIEDTVPENTDLFLDRTIEELFDAYRLKQLLREPGVELEPLFTLDVPRPMVKLPPRQRELNAEARRIGNSAGLDVLFHESWLQRLGGETESLPIIIDTPVRLGDYPELQGSLLLYSSRYLHVNTHLWLNTDGRYLGEETAGWRMPPPPPPVDQSLPVWVPFRIDPAPDWLDVSHPGNGVAAAAASGSTRSAEGSFSPAEGAYPGAEGFYPGAEGFYPGAEGSYPRAEGSYPGAEGSYPGAEESYSPAEGAPSLAGGASSPAEGALSDSLSPAPASAAELRAFLDAPVRDYAFRHAVPMRQQRRMRSGELHYIDHPLLGVVIRVDRYEFEPFVLTPDGNPDR